MQWFSFKHNKAEETLDNTSRKEITFKDIKTHLTAAIKVIRKSETSGTASMFAGYLKQKYFQLREELCAGLLLLFKPFSWLCFSTSALSTLQTVGTQRIWYADVTAACRHVMTARGNDSLKYPSTTCCHVAKYSRYGWGKRTLEIMQ